MKKLNELKNTMLEREMKEADIVEKIRSNKYDISKDPRIGMQEHINVSYLVYGDWCFYSNREHDHFLYRIRLDGTKNEQLTDHTVSNICSIADGKLYYMDLKVGQTVARKINSELVACEDFFEKSIDISSLVDLSENYEKNIEDYYFNSFEKHNYDVYEYGDWIYYKNEDMGGFLYRIKNNGEENERLTNFTVNNFSSDQIEVENGKRCFKKIYKRQLPDFIWTYVDFCIDDKK